MQRYDEDYQNLILKINEAFNRNQSSTGVYKSAFEQLNEGKKQSIEQIPQEEIQKIGARVRKDVCGIEYLTPQEEELLAEVRAGRKRNYKQFVFRLSGVIDGERIMQNYRSLMQEEVFRTLYLYEGLERPVRIVCRDGESIFPIYNVQSLERDRQTLLIKNVLAAEMRREYHIEKDQVFRIQGYLMAKDEMLVVISLYPFVPYPLGIRGMLYKIFDQMKTQSSDVPGIDEAAVKKMNEELKAKSLAYWKKIMLPSGKALTIPGESRGQETAQRAFLHKELSEELVEQLTKFCREKNISVKAAFLAVWGSLMGKYHDEKHPLVLAAMNGEKMNLFPIRIFREEKGLQNLSVIDTQLNGALSYSSCSVEDVEAQTGIVFADFFRMAHSFVEFNELDALESGSGDLSAVNGIGPEDIDVNLVVSYHLFEKNISMHYLSKSGIMEIILDNLHELFLEELRHILSGDGAGFDKKSFIRMSDTDAEKLQKIRLAQIGLYLKESGLVESLTVEEIMKLSGYCRLTTWLSNDRVVSEHSMLSSLYIVGEGMLEESRTEKDGIVKSLRIVKKGCIFGIESLFSKPEAKTTYTVASSQAQVVEIDQHILKEIFRRKPEGWITLLEREAEQKARLQRLWTMN